MHIWYAFMFKGVESTQPLQRLLTTTDEHKRQIILYDFIEFGPPLLHASSPSVRPRADNFVWPVGAGDDDDRFYTGKIQMRLISEFGRQSIWCGIELPYPEAANIHRRISYAH